MELNNNFNHNNFNKFKKKLIKNPAMIGDDIYNSTQIKDVKHTTDMLAAKRLRASKHPGKTGIIPEFYNRRYSSPAILINEGVETFESDNSSFNSINSDNSNVSSINLDNPTCFIDKCDQIIDNRFHERKFVKKSRDNNNFLAQFEPARFDNPRDPVSSNAIPHKIGHKAGTARYELERDLALKSGFSNFDNTDMTYNVVDSEALNNFSNTLKPFFGSKGGYGMDRFHEDQLYSQNQRRMELFTGSPDNLSYRPRIERVPLFNPVMGLTNIYGSPVMTDFYEKRYVPSRERRNELPFQPIRVTPGLGLGANENNKQGYQDMFRVLPKTVDELRTLNNPKVSYEGVVIPGMKGQRGPVPSKMYKRRPVTFREYGPEWLIKGVGDYRAPGIKGEIDPGTLATINRGMAETPYLGPAGTAVERPTPEALMPKVHASNRQTFLHAEPRNLLYQEAQKARGFNESYDPRMTQRSMKNDNAGFIGNQQISKNITQNYNDIPDMTMREIYAHNNRAGMVGNQQIDKNKSYNYNDIPDLTRREIYAHTDRAGQVSNQQFDKIKSYNFNDIQDLTMRNIHEKTDRVGLIGNQQFDKNKSYNYNDIQDLTMRNIHDKTDRVGQIGNQQFDKIKSYNYNDIPDLTVRNLHERTDRVGLIGNQQFDKNKSYNYNDIPDMTMRNIHERTDRVGQIGNQQFDKNKAYNYNDIPDMTMRNVHDRTDRAGQIGNRQFDKNKSYNYNDIPDLTMRNVHDRTDRAGQIGNQQFDKSRSYNYNDIPDLTMRNLHERTDRSGQIGNQQFSKNKSYNYNDIPDLTLRNIHDKTDRAGHIGNRQFDKNKSYNYNDIPDLTMRNVHERTDRVGQIGNQQFDKNKSYNYNDIPDLTMRNLHERTDRVGQIGNRQFDKNKSYNYNDVPDLTLRNLHDKTDRVGQIGNQQFSKNQAYNYNDIPDLNMRNLHERTDRSGQIGNQQFSKPYAFDFVNNVPDITMREIHSKSDRAGMIGNSDQQKNKSANYNDIPDVTMREIHARADRAGNIGNEQFHKPYAFDFINNIPDTTMREIQIRNNYINPLRFNEQQRSRADANNMDVNIIREQISRGREPTLSNYSKGPTFEFTMMEQRDPIQINRDLYQDIKTDNFCRLSQMATKTSDQLPQTPWRFYSYIDENLKGNPYVNNVVHQSPV